MSATILVLYYSRYGAVKQMAHHITRGVESIDGAIARIRTVPPVSPQNEATIPPIPETGAVYATLDDVRECDGLALGSPTRFGNMASPLKYFVETLTPLWISGELIDKPAAVFTSSASLHGGQETTLLTMMLPLMHLGCMIVGVPCTAMDLHQTTTGGTPYGPTHIAGADSKNPLSAEEERLCFLTGQRLARVALNMKGI